MKKSHRKNNRKPLTDKINCFNCGHCTYIGEGDHICDMSTDVIIADWQPTEYFYQCEGKDFNYDRTR